LWETFGQFFVRIFQGNFQENNIQQKIIDGKFLQGIVGVEKFLLNLERTILHGIPNNNLKKSKPLSKMIDTI
jgi:hypothetical protein